MKSLTKLLSAAGLSLAVVATAAPAAAQVDGRLATADVTRAIINTNALQTAYNQIGTTYQAQIQTRQTKQQELTTLLQPFDTNRNGQLDDAELPAVQSSPSFAQIQTLEGEVASLTNQVNGARIYAVEQVLVRYPEALTQIVNQQQIVMVVQPDVIQFAAEGADITEQVTGALNTLVPQVAIVPPAEWRPSRQGLQIFQEIQQYLILAQQQAAADSAQQQPPASQAPVGR